ncbi:MSHA biogenesis protein MshK [Photobacterium jeanii]|uniref:MSHA biogenesis protein MshK n=2 Tax=Photobacterium jeanii TaxID=858640 RepID=A0A178KGV8_9GAMM|nr:MSHA biogenesis protein MshK [Photobacterium jeanii]
MITKQQRWGLLAAMLVASASSHTAWASQDPTAPLGWQAPAKKQVKVRARVPQLQGIFCEQQSDCNVIINNKLVGVGGRVSGYTLTAIHDDSVTVTRNGKQWQLELFAENIKTN